MKILGIHNGHHSNICNLEDAMIKNHLESEKITGIKGINNAATSALNLSKAKFDIIGATSADIEKILEINSDPKLLRDVLTYPHVKFETKINSKQQIGYMINHHIAHASYAYYNSPFNESLVLSFDGRGDHISSLLCLGKNNHLTPLEVLPFRAGMIFSAMGYYLFGMGAEYGGDKTHPAGKLMGLAAYGTSNSKWKTQFKEIIWQKDYYPDTIYFDYSNKFDGLKLHKNCFTPEQKIAQDFACTAQEVFSEETIKIILSSVLKYKINNICISGGCALNGITNTKIHDLPEITDTFIPPAVHDAGLSIGVAQYIYHHIFNNEKNNLNQDLIYLGRDVAIKEINSPNINTILNHYNLKSNHMDEPEQIEFIAKALSENKIVGLIKGRIESGARALGHRSIFSNPLNPESKDLINNKVKHREWYRPFAALTLAESAQNYFEFDKESPYMLYVVNVKSNEIPGVTHVDHSSRLQTIRQEQNSFIYNTTKRFGEITGIPVILNTSYNDRGQPILDDLNKILSLYVSTDMDYLIVDNQLITKK